MEANGKQRCGHHMAIFLEQKESMVTSSTYSLGLTKTLRLLTSSTATILRLGSSTKIKSFLGLRAEKLPSDVFSNIMILPNSLAVWTRSRCGSSTTKSG